VRVAVLGAGGIIAPAIVRDLAESEEVDALRLLDLDESRARRVAEDHGAGKAEAKQADARSDLPVALEGCDVLVNSASYRVNLDAMRACLEAGCHYIDLGGLYWMTGRQLELHDEFESAGLLALLGMGSSPGKTNVMAVRAVRELGGPPERIDVGAAGRDPDPPPGFSLPYALQTLLDELTMAPMAIRDGEAVELEPLAEGATMAFSEPIGAAPTIQTIHSEMRTFPESFGCREASFNLSLAPALESRLRELTAAPPEEVAELARTAVPPSAETVSVHLIAASSEGRSVTVTAVTSPIEEWGLGGGVVSTAAPAAAAVRLMASGPIEARGALPPERCVDPDDLFPELERRACAFEVLSAVAS